MITETDLRSLRLAAINAHRPWKAEILMCDQIAGGDWEITWPDLETEQSGPLVENLYAQALEDKSMTAAAVPFMVHTPPTRGTRKDRGEQVASKRRRVFVGYHERSNLRKVGAKMYRDWFHTGVMVGNPWATGFVNTAGQGAPPKDRWAYIQTVNPRHLYPLGWDNRGRLSSGLLIRRRRLASLEADWGKTNPAVLMAKLRREGQSAQRQTEWLEEIWYFDGYCWAVALGDSTAESFRNGAVFGPATDSDLTAQGNMLIHWIVEPSEHGLGSCPLKAVARVTHDDSPRGALLDILPPLRTAQNFMARLLDDLNLSIYAPTVLDNIENPEEYGLGAVLIGTGQGQANILRDRPPVNFEAQQTVDRILDQTRRQAFEPAQRSGEAGASIISGKGTMSLMGTFNTELATAQADYELVMRELTSAAAAMDEMHCYGTKEISIYDSTSRDFVDETYDPKDLFKGDWRVVVSYGDRTGLDNQQHIIQLATMRNLDAMALRTFMQKSGMVDDALAEETEITIEKLTSLFVEGLLPQQIQAGDKEALVDFIDKIDSDKKSIREAMFETIRQTKLTPADGQGPAPGSPAGRADIMRMMRSLSQGGVPGSAEGQPPTQLPGPVRRQLATAAPGSDGP